MKLCMRGTGIFSWSGIAVPTKMPCIGDIEASGLAPESYPIEIAWSLPSGEIRSSLIQTHPSWRDYWDPLAEVMHHSSREMLRAEELPAADMAEKLNQDLAGEKVYFDGGGYDQYWLGRFYQAAGMKPSFKFRDFDRLLAIVGVRDTGRQEAAEALAIRDLGDLQRHRAANDVKFLQRWYIRARGGPHH